MNFGGFVKKWAKPAAYGAAGAFLGGPWGAAAGFGLGGGFGTGDVDEKIDPYERELWKERMKWMKDPQFQSTMSEYLGGEYDPSEVEDYYRQGIHDPAVRQYEQTTRPAWMQKVGSLHSSHRAGMERRGYEGLYSGLSQQRAQLMYGERQQARQRQQQIMSNIMGQQFQSPTTFVAQPSFIDQLGKVGTAAGSLKYAFS